ncbi:MAG TPA: biopolymer transporter ExbD, partial [Vicinamibacterales bacterium]|nr:biopolymer transporter ExbD [Vicinamibacterales bacterium]
DQKVPLGVLEERMRQELQGKTDKQVYLKSDGGVDVQDLMTVMDRLKAAGVQKVGIVSKLPGER